MAKRSKKKIEQEKEVVEMSVSPEVVETTELIEDPKNSVTKTKVKRNKEQFSVLPFNGKTFGLNPNIFNYPYDGQGFNPFKYSLSDNLFVPLVCGGNAIPTIDVDTIPVGTMYITPYPNPTSLYIFLGKAVDANGDPDNRWLHLPIGGGPINTVLANIHVINQNDTGTTFDISPNAVGQIQITFDELLKAVQDGSNGLTIQNLSIPVFRINGNPNEIVSYTNTDKFIDIEAGSGIVLTKTDPNKYSISSTSAPAPDPNAVYSLVSDTGFEATAINHKIKVFGISNDGIVTRTQNLNTDTIEIAVLTTRGIPYKYTIGESYVSGDIVFHQQQGYVVMATVTATTPAPQLPDFVLIRTFQRGSKVTVGGNPTGNAVLCDNNGIATFNVSSPSTLDITANTTTGALDFTVDAVNTLLDSSNNVVTKDANSRIQITCAGGSTQAIATGVLQINPPTVDAVRGVIAGNSTPPNNQATPDTSGNLLFSSANSRMTITRNVTNTNEVDFAVSPFIDKIVGNNTSEPIVPDTNNQIQLASTNPARLTISRRTASTNILDFSIINPFDGIKDQDGVKLGKDSQNCSQISIGTETDLTFKMSQISLESYKGILKQTANPIKFIEATTGTAVPTAYKPSTDPDYLQSSAITIIGDTPVTGDPVITTRAVGNTVFIKATTSSTLQNYIATGTIGDIQVPVWNPVTQTLTVFAGQGVIYNGATNSYFLVNWLQQDLPLAPTQPSYQIYVNNAGIVFSETAYSPVTLRTAIRLGSVAIDTAQPTSSYFQFQPTKITNPSTLLDVMVALGPSRVGASYSGVGLVISSTVTSPTVATLNNTAGRIMYPYINSSNSQYNNPNFTDVFPASAPLTQSYRYRNATGDFIIVLGQQNVTQLYLTQYAPAGSLTNISNNQWAFSLLYFIRNQNNISASTFIHVLGNTQSTTQSEALQDAQDFSAQFPLRIVGILPQQITFLGALTWQFTNANRTQFLHFTNSTNNGLLLGGGGSVPPTPIVQSNDITKKGPFTPILPILNVTGSTITIGAGQGYIMGELLPWNGTTFSSSATGTATTTMWLVYANINGTIGQTQILALSNLATLYPTACPLFMYWANNANAVHNISTFRDGLLQTELSGDAILRLRQDAYTSNAVSTVTQTTAGGLLNCTLSTPVSSQFTHKLFNSTFDASVQTGIPRYRWSGIADKISYTLPVDTLWRMSILFICNCETLPPVIFTQYENKAIKDSKVAHIIEDKGECICFNKKGDPILKNAKVVGRNTGFYYELFVDDQGFINSADAKYHTVERYGQLYVPLTDSMAIKYCLYQGNEMIRVYETELNGRAKGGYMAFVDNDGNYSVCI